MSSESEGKSCSIFPTGPENQLKSLEKTIVEYFGKLEQRLSEVETVMRRSPQYLSDSEEYNNSLKEHALRIAKQVAISHKFQIEKDSRKHQIAIRKYNSAINSRLEATTEQLQKLGASAKTNTAILVDSINHATRKKRKRTSSLCQDSSFQLQQNDTPQDTFSEEDFKKSSYTSNDKSSDVREVNLKRSFQETKSLQETVSNVPSKVGDSSQVNTFGYLIWISSNKRKKIV